ncbi:MAG: hypothetical protein ACLUIQ_07880 [Dialister invisus]
MESDYVLFAKARSESTKQIIMRHGLEIYAFLLSPCSLPTSVNFLADLYLQSRSSLSRIGKCRHPRRTARRRAYAPRCWAVFSALFVFAGNMMANIAYGIIDPRIREGGNLDA